MEEIIQPYEASLILEAHHFKDENNIKHINEYELKDKIGEGSYCKVCKVSRQWMEGTELFKGDYAAKIFHKVSLSSKRIAVYEGPEQPTMTNLLDSVYKEIEIWKYFEHANLLKLYQIIDDPDDEKIYCIMQLAELGQIMNWNEEELKYEHRKDILSFLKEKYFPDYVFSSLYLQLEAIGKIVFDQVIKGIQFLHEQNIIHRDIKIDNILCKSTDDEAPIKLSDFTTTCKFTPGKNLYDLAGTPGFRAPELMYTTEQGYEPLPLDAWSLGVCLYTFFNESMPFFSLSEIECDIQAMKNELVFDESKFMSKDLIDLITGMLKKKPEERMTLDEIILHPWFFK